MKISARNQFPGKIVKINRGAVNGIVTLDVKGVRISSTISLSAIDELELAEDKDAIAVIKATEVMVATEDPEISARNKFPGKIVSIQKGAVNDIVRIDSKAGQVTATISDGAVKELGLTEGMDAIAVVKATSVMIGVE